MTSSAMTKGERDALARLARRRAHVARAAAAERAAELLADFEQQLAAIYTPDDDAAFRALYDETRAATEAADQRLAERCRELGIPDQFRPQLQASWYGRGENALAARRAELRRVATTTIAAAQKRAVTEIERQSVEVETRLIAGGLHSDAAQRFLEAMPTVEALMPSLSLAEIQAVSGERRSLSLGTGGAAL